MLLWLLNISFVLSSSSSSSYLKRKRKQKKQGVWFINKVRWVITCDLNSSFLDPTKFRDTCLEIVLFTMLLLFASGRGAISLSYKCPHLYSIPFIDIIFSSSNFYSYHHHYHHHHHHHQGISLVFILANAVAIFTTWSSTILSFLKSMNEKIAVWRIWKVFGMWKSFRWFY